MAAKKKTDIQEEVQTVKAEAVQEEETAEAVQEEETAFMRGRVKGGSLNVRREPVKANNIVRILADGEETNLVRADTEDEWFQTEDGFYVMAEFIDLI